MPLPPFEALLYLRREHRIVSAVYLIFIATLAATPKLSDSTVACSPTAVNANSINSEKVKVPGRQFDHVIE